MTLDIWLILHQNINIIQQVRKQNLVVLEAVPSLCFGISLEFLIIFYLESWHTNITIPDAELVFPMVFPWMFHVWNILEVTETWALLGQEEQGLH